MTTVDEKEILEIEELKARVSKTLQDIKYAPVKLYLAVGVVMGAGFVKIVELLIVKG